MSNEIEYYDLTAKLLIKIIEYGSDEFKAFMDKTYSLIVKSTESLNNLYYTLNEIINDQNYITSEDNKLIVAIYLHKINEYSRQQSIINQTILNKKPLNNKLLDIIEIYPTYSGIIRNNHESTNLFYYFNNLMIYYKSTNTLKNTKIINYYIPLTKEEINIAFIPYPKSNIEFKNIIKNNIHYCYVDEKENLNDNDYEYIEKCKNTIINNNIDILFGPELNGSRLLDKKLKELLDPLKFENRPFIIACPSYHNFQNKLRYNTSTLYIREISSINKEKIYKNIYSTINQNKIEVTEDINLDKKQIPIFHIEGIGKLCFLICKDYISDYLIDFIKHLNIDIIIVQCHTEITSPKFEGNMKTLALHKHITIIGNSCSTENKKNSKLLYTLNKENIDTLQCNECNYQNSQCLKIIKISIEDNKLKTETITERGIPYEKISN